MSVQTPQTHENSSIAEAETIELANTTVELVDGPGGVVARIRRRDGREYAGPLDDATISALREVGR